MGVVRGRSEQEKVSLGSASVNHVTSEYNESSRDRLRAEAIPMLDFRQFLANFSSRKTVKRCEKIARFLQQIQKYLDNSHLKWFIIRLKLNAF